MPRRSTRIKDRTARTGAPPASSESSARPPAPPLQSLVTQLPAEVMSWICTLAARPGGPFPCTQKQRRIDLLDLALFHRSWTRAARGEAAKARTIDVYHFLRPEKDVKQFSRGLVKGGGALPLECVESFYSAFPALKTLRISDTSASDELLSGSTTVEKLVLFRVDLPRLGMFASLQKLSIAQCCGDALGTTLMHENFPSLEHLSLRLRNPSIDTTEVGHLVVVAPPQNLRSLALQGSGYFDLFASLLAAATRLKKLHIELPPGSPKFRLHQYKALKTLKNLSLTVLKCETGVRATRIRRMYEHLHRHDFEVIYKRWKAPKHLAIIELHRDDPLRLVDFPFICPDFKRGVFRASFEVRQKSNKSDKSS